MIKQDPLDKPEPPTGMAMFEPEKWTSANWYWFNKEISKELTRGTRV